MWSANWKRSGTICARVETPAGALTEPVSTARTTGVVWPELAADARTRCMLFDDSVQAEKIKEVYAVADELRLKFGKHRLHAGLSLAPK